MLVSSPVEADQGYDSATTTADRSNVINFLGAHVDRSMASKTGRINWK